jgi:hypothetical protein
MKKIGYCRVCQIGGVPISQKLVVPRGYIYRTDDDEIIEGRRVESNIVDMCEICSHLSRSIIWYARQNDDTKEVRRLMQRAYLVFRTRYENKEYIKDYIEEQQKDGNLLAAQHLLSEAEERGGDQKIIERVRRYLWLSDMFHTSYASVKMKGRTYRNFDDYLENL